MSQPKQVIKLNILAHIAVKNLFYKRLRTGLTILGVVIGIGSIVFLLSLGFGLQKLVASQVIGSQSIKTIDITSPKAKSVTITPDRLADFRNLSGVEKAARVYFSSGKVSYRGSQTDSVVYGADQDYVDLSSLKLVAGKRADASSVKEVVVNTSLLKAIGRVDSKKVVGETINVKITIPAQKEGGQDTTIDKTFVVRGVIESGAGAELYTSATVFDEQDLKSVTQAKLLVADRNQIAAVRKQVENQGFVTSSPIDTINQINQIFNLLNVVLVGFGGIGMVIAILGMFNTLTISLLERTKEFGLMISLGARARDIRRLFIAEAMTLSVLGGALGIVAAVILGALVNIFVNGFAQARGINESVSLFSVSPLLVVATLVFVAGLGFVVVLYPAYRAAHINPVDSMRRD